MIQQNSGRSIRGPLLLASIWLTVAAMGAESGESPEAGIVIQSACEVDYPPFCFTDERGAATGFSVELMQAAAASMGREVSFRIGPWSEVRSLLERGEVQALPLVGRTPEREALFEFTFPYMSLFGAIVVRSDSKGIQGMDDLRGKRVAVMKSDNMEEFLRREAREFGIHTTPTFEDALRGLSAGRYDAVVIQRLVALRLMQQTGLTNLRIVAQPVAGFRQDFCFAVKYGDRETLALLNEGLALVMADGTFRRLHAKWFAALELPSARRIVVGGDHNYPPYEYLDPRGRPAGFNVELTRAIAHEMGLDIQFRLGSWAEVLRGLESGEIDVVQGMFYSPERERKFDFAPPHLMNHYVAVVRTGPASLPDSLSELAGKRIVVQRGDLIHDVLLASGFGDRVSVAETQEDVLRELAEGRHDCALVVRISALHVIRRRGWNRLVLGRRPLFSAEYCYAVADGQRALVTQFGEGLAVLRESGEYRRIHDQWLAVYDDPSVNMATILKYVAMAAVPLFSLLVASYWWSWSLRRQVASRTAALRESEHHFRSLVEGAPDAIFVQTEDRFVYLNPAACLLFGADSSDLLLGQPVMDRVHPADHEAVRQRIHALRVEKAKVPPHEVTWLRLDGSEVPVEVSAVPILYQGQDGALVFGHDFTARKQVEETLRHSRESYRDLIENLNEVVFSLRSDGTIDFVSPVVQELLGDAPQDLLGRHFSELVFPDDLDEANAGLAEATGGAGHAVRELRLLNTTGVIHWVRASSRVRIQHGVPNGLQGVLTDIAEQKTAEAERERLIAAIEQSGEEIMITDPAGTIQYVNSTFEAATGYACGEVLGRNPRILKSGEHDEAFYRQLWQTIRDGKEWQGRMVNRCKDGSLYTVDAAISPVRDRRGRIVNYVGVSRDVTEQIRQAAQLQQAQKMESIGRLAGGVAHDFNNLLSVILGYVGLVLAETPEGDSNYDKLREIRKAGERASDLTRQLLAFSRKQVLQPVAFDLNEVVADIEKMLRRILGEDIDLRLVLGRDLGAIVADPGQIEQVIMNLAVNARDAMPAGGKLTVETANIEVDEEFAEAHQDLRVGAYVRLAVTDTGSGMDASTLARAFEPFFTTKGVGQGTGLGLPTAYGIVKQSGGDIRVYSEPGRGTTFRVYLPRTQGAETVRVERGQERIVQGAGQQLLVVEDDPALRRLLEISLTSCGYRVALAADGEQALMAIEQQGLRPDLVLTDVVMPGMSGKVLAERLRAKQPGLKVLFMSGYTDNAIVHHGVLNPNVPFIHKPFRRTELTAKIAELLRDAPDSVRPKKTILMIDDEEAIRMLVDWACKKRGHDFVGVGNLKATMEALAAQSFDVLLIDMNLLGNDGATVLREIRATGCSTPAVMFTGDASSVDMNELGPLGAVAVVEKSSDTDPLLQMLEQLVAGP